MELESHVILKQYSKLESEIENLDITNDLKRETKDLIKDREKLMKSKQKQFRHKSYKDGKNSPKKEKRSSSNGNKWKPMHRT